MKFNWGWGIAIFMACFVAFILSFVVRSFQNNVDLEYEDYYERELVHQEVIDATENALSFTKNISVGANQKEVTIKFPKDFVLQITSGKVTFFRANDKKLDRIFPLNLENNQQSFDYNNFKTGNYRVIIEFKDKTKSYYIKKEVNV